MNETNYFNVVLYQQTIWSLDDNCSKTNTKCILLCIVEPYFLYTSCNWISVTTPLHQLVLFWHTFSSRKQYMIWTQSNRTSSNGYIIEWRLVNLVFDNCKLKSIILQLITLHLMRDDGVLSQLPIYPRQNKAIWYGRIQTLVYQTHSAITVTMTQQ